VGHVVFPNVQVTETVISRSDYINLSHKEYSFNVTYILFSIQTTVKSQIFEWNLFSFCWVSWYNSHISQIQMLMKIPLK